MPVSIQLRQEGWVRATGYQCTQWIARQPTPPGSTSPSSLADLFVFRRTGETEVLDRVASAPDMQSLPVARLTGLVVRGTGGNLITTVLPGDTLTITKAVPHWIQSGAPYTNQVFRVAQVQLRNFGSYTSGAGPQILPGSRLRLPNYSLSNADIGKWIILEGFASVSYNQPVQILGVEGSVALINIPTSTTESGSYWSHYRITIDPTAVGTGEEARYFPSIEDALTWTVTRGGSTIVSGTGGITERANPFLTYYRDHRVTTLESSGSEATARLLAIKQHIAHVELEQNSLDTPFATVQTFDYPPVT